jgi:hypothetical protein
MNRARFCRAKLGTTALAAAIRSANVFSLCRTDLRRAGRSAVRRWTVRFVLPLLIVAYAGLVATDVQAHPHVWVTMTTELVYAPDGSATAVRHAWTFDDMFSAFATQGIAARAKGQFTRAELQPLAQTKPNRSRNMPTSPTPRSTVGCKRTRSANRQTIGSIMIPRAQYLRCISPCRSKNR